MTSSAFPRIGSCAAFALATLLPLPAQEAACTFDASQVQVGPLDPALEAIFDLDGDPYPDAVGALFGTSSSVIGIYRNDGTGRFQPVWSTTASGWFGLNFVLAGDFDGDGRRDDFALVVSGSVQIFYCDGVGAPTVIGPVTPCPVTNLRDAAVADLDNDGRDDLIVSALDNTSTPIVYSVSMFRSGAAGASPTITTVQPSLYPARVRSARLQDGSHRILVIDGLQTAQMLSVDPTGSNVQILPQLTLSTGLGDPTAGDIDGDGDIDFVVFGMVNNAGIFQVLRQQAGVFTVEPMQVGGPATGLADVDGDGDLDGICCGGGGGGSPPLPNHRVSNFEIALNDGSGGFAPSFLIPGMGARHIAGAVDVDSDGDIDLVAGRVVYFAQRPMTSVPFRRMEDIWFGGEGDFAGPRDADGDGDIDAGCSPFGTHVNLGTGDFVATPTQSPIDVQFVLGSVSADLDGDGDLDALVTVSAFGNPPIAPGVWRVMQDRPGHWQLGTYAMPLQTTAINPEYFFRSYVLDLDGDGFHDLIVTSDLQPNSSTSNDLTSIYHSAPDGRLTTPGLSAFTVKEIADFNGDGLPDLLVARRSIGYGVCLNRGSMQFDPPNTVLATPTTSFHDRPSVADLDGDGDLDLVLPEASGGNVATTVVLALNDGTGQFQVQPRQPSFPDFSATTQHIAKTADVNGDGRPDLLLFPGRDAFATTILVNTGQGQFVDSGTQVVHPQYLADFDGDGATDVASITGHSIFLARCGSAALRGAFEQHGNSGVGTGGAHLLLGAKGPFRAGGTIELRILGGRGGAFGGLVIGLGGADLRDVFGPGQDLYIDAGSPTLAVGVFLSGTPNGAGTGTLTIPVSIPPAMVGIELHHQVGIADPTAPLGLVTSNGLWIRYGS